MNDVAGPFHGVSGMQLARLLQLASPALPIGAYSYSSGLESALELGLVRDADSARRWLVDAVELVQGRFDAPLVAAACSSDDAGEIARLDALALAARETAELRLEAEQMGYSLGAWLAQVPQDAVSEVGPKGAAGAAPTAQGGPVRSGTVRSGPVRSGPVAFGRAAALLDLPAAVAATAWLWGFVENQVMVLIKAMPLGQIGGQRLLWALGPVVAQTGSAAALLPRGQWSSAMPGLAIASMAHERQYSRLFRS